MWCSLREEDKEEFLSSYFSVFMSYRVSIPSENAEKILSYLLSGQVKIASGKHLVVGYDSDGVDIEHAGGSVHRYSKVINAVGSPRDVTQLDSLLVRNLLSRKYVSPDRHGGLKVDPYTYRAINQAGSAEAGIRVLGELTVGAFFFTSALDINSRHAQFCCTEFFAGLNPCVTDGFVDKAVRA